MGEDGAPAPDSVRITIKPKGPYVIEGPVVIRHPDGTVIEPPPAKQPGLVKLCGCGQSLTKPFCDGSHKLCARSEGEAGPEPGSPAL
jgi:CDGSH-type Zn-finger protein